MSVNAMYSTFELNLVISQLLNHVSYGTSCLVMLENLISFCSASNIQHFTLWFLHELNVSELGWYSFMWALCVILVMGSTGEITGLKLIAGL